MRRLALVCSWILLVLFVLLGASSYVVGMRSGGFAIAPVIVFGTAILAFYSRAQRWIVVIASVLSALFGLGACVFVVTGINFAASGTAFLVGATLLVVLCVPAVVNVVALLPRALGRRQVRDGALVGEAEPRR